MCRPNHKHCETQAGNFRIPAIPAHTYTHSSARGSLELTLKLDFAAGIRLRLKAEAGEHGQDAALEVLRAADVEFPDGDARHVGDPKDCVRHVRLFPFRYAKMRIEQQ